MSFLDRLGRKQSAVARIVAAVYAGTGQPVWTPIEYKRLAQEGYQHNTWVYACVSGIAAAAKGIPWVLYQGQGARGQRAAKMIRSGNEAALRRAYGRPPGSYLAGCTPAVRARAWAIRTAVERKELVEVESHPLLDLFDRPNPEMGGGAFQEAFFGYWLISGNAYVEGVPAGRPPVELWPHRPDRITVIPDTKNRIGGYEYKVAGSAYRFDPADLMHTKFFHPTNDWYGMSPLEAAARAVDRDNAAESWNTALLQNGGRPSGALTTDTELGEQQKIDLKAALDERQGPKAAGRPLLLEGGLKWQEMGLTPRDMDWLNAQKWSLKRISAAYGYPMPLLDPEASATYANYAEARLALYQDRVLPLMDHAADDWNRWLTPKFGDGLVLTYDVDGIEALQEDRNQAWQRTDDTRMTVNERREAVGLDPIPGGDVILVPTTVTARPVDDLEAPPPPEPADPNADDPNADDPAAAKQRRRKAAEGVAPDWWQQGADEWMLQVTGLKVSQVTDTTRAILAAIIQTGVSEGESMQQIADRIRTAYAEMSETRAQLIARTEVIGAANAGGRFAALSTGLDLTREWLATLDERTRPDHLDANGQKRAMHEPYDVGGYQGMFPGDPSLPPSEVCNCRCTEVFLHSAKRMADTPETRAAWWEQHDQHRAAWERLVAQRCAARFAEEGAAVAGAVAGAADTHAAQITVTRLDTTPWLTLYRGFYTGVMEDFGHRTLTDLTGGS